MSISAAIYGWAGAALSDAESRFFRSADPFGFIVFLRNIETPEQLERLTGELRETVGRDAPVLIDQEGGRVARLKPPHWRAAPPAARFGQLASRDRNAAAGEGFRVQLAAVKSEADANAEWTKLQKAHADLLGGLKPTIQRADLGAQGIFYRIQGGPLASRDAAVALCDALKAKDQACLVVTP